MSIEEILPTVVLIAVVYLLIRWFNKSGPATTAEGGIRGVTLSMVETMNSTFPDIPAPNIIYSLSRTRSVQATSEEILERGFLPAPPATFTVPSSLLPPSATAPVTTSTDTTQINAKSSTPTKTQSLIERYGLGTRLPTLKGKEKEGLDAPCQDQSFSPESNSKSGEKNTWADTKERREQELKARKERVILEARKRMLEKQAKLSQVSS